MKIKCPVCMHHCEIEEGNLGRCKARQNKNGEIICTNYGKITSLALDPIEKKPFKKFYSGSRILSVGSYGCNMHCSFCQNYMISAVRETETCYEFLTPEELIAEALNCRRQGNIGIAYTYNEPLIGYEYVRDCARLAQKKGLKNAVVTNGCAEGSILEEILPYIDAFNIDLKAFDSSFYEKEGGSLSLVQDFIRRAAPKSHVEITTLVIPGENDSEKEIEEAARWLASLNQDIPYHVTRFFPQWKKADCAATKIETIYRLADTARKHLNFVYEGNC